jgi:hypothetical protein
MNVVFTCVTEPTKKYLDQSARLLMSLRWFGGTLANARFVLGTTGPIPEEAARLFSRYGAQVVLVERYADEHGPSNKVSLLKSPALAGQDVVVLIDCDTIVVRDPAPWLNVPGIAAKLADVHSVQLQDIEQVFLHFGLRVPEARFTHELTGDSNIAYCNSGVVVVHEEHRARFAADWDRWNRAVLELPAAIPFKRYHVDQLSLALTIENSGIPFEELPAEMNMPVHLDEKFYPASWHSRDPVIIHYHGLAYSNGFLKPNFLFQVSRRIESFNARLRAELSAAAPAARVHLPTRGPTITRGRGR